MGKTSIDRYETSTGESMEQKIVRIQTNGEPVEDPNVAKTYTERKNGVPPQFDIRTDTRVLAQEAMTMVSESYTNKRNDRIAEAENGQTEEPQTEE